VLVESDTFLHALDGTPGLAPLSACHAPASFDVTPLEQGVGVSPNVRAPSDAAETPPLELLDEVRVLRPDAGASSDVAFGEVRRKDELHEGVSPIDGKGLAAREPRDRSGPHVRIGQDTVETEGENLGAGLAAHRGLGDKRPVRGTGERQGAGRNVVREAASGCGPEGRSGEMGCFHAARFSNSNHLDNARSTVKKKVLLVGQLDPSWRVMFL